MNAERTAQKRAWVGRFAGPLVLAAIGFFQLLVFSRTVGVYQTKVAEALPSSASPQAVAAQLERAVATDPSNGWAQWLLSKENVRLAELTGGRAEAYRAQAKKATDPQRRDFYALNATEEIKRQGKYLESAKSRAALGARSFNGVETFKQMASIHLRTTDTKTAEYYLRMVARVKPDDIEAIERLGTIDLYEQKWDELRDLAERIVRRHPYSALAYFFRAFIASKVDLDADAYRLNVRQAYLMMKQSATKPWFDTEQIERLAVKLNLVEPPAAKQ